MLLAAESLRHFWSVEGDQAMRRAMALLPRPAVQAGSVDTSADPKLSPNGTRVALVSDEGTLQIYDVTAQRVAQSIPAKGATLLGWSPDGEMLLGLGEDRVARAWLAADGSEQRLFTISERDPAAFAFSTDRQVIALAEEGEDTRHAGPVHVWNMATRRHSMFTPSHSARALWLAGDGSRVVVMGSSFMASAIEAWEPPFQKAIAQDRLDGMIEFPSSIPRGRQWLSSTAWCTSGAAHREPLICCCIHSTVRNPMRCVCRIPGGFGELSGTQPGPISPRCVRTASFASGRATGVRLGK